MFRETIGGAPAHGRSVAKHPSWCPFIEVRTLCFIEISKWSTLETVKISKQI